MLDEERNLQLLEEVYQMESAFPRNISTSAHDWGQVLMFQGKSGSVFGSFTKLLYAGCLLTSIIT